MTTTRPQSERRATPAEEAAAEAALLRLCLTNARDAAWAEWFHETVYTRPGGKVAALAFYRANCQERTP